MPSEKHTGVNIYLDVAPVAIPVSAGAALIVPDEGAFVPLIGRSTGISIDGNRFEFDAEFGDADSYWRSGSTITDRGWTMPFDGYFKNNDPSQQILEDAVWKETEAGTEKSPYIYIRRFPLGKINNAKFTHGFATVDSLDNTDERAGSLDTSYSFTGEGKLFRGRFLIPTYVSKTPASGAPGTAVAYTGTNMEAVVAVQYRQGATVVGTQSTLTSRSTTGFTAAVPAGLASGAYSVFLVYVGGALAAGNHTVA